MSVKAHQALWFEKIQAVIFICPLMVLLVFCCIVSSNIHQCDSSYISSVFCNIKSLSLTYITTSLDLLWEFTGNPDIYNTQECLSAQDTFANLLLTLKLVTLDAAIKKSKNLRMGQRSSHRAPYQRRRKIFETGVLGQKANSPVRGLGVQPPRC